MTEEERKEAAKVASRRWYVKNRAVAIARAAAFARANPEKVKEYRQRANASPKQREAKRRWVASHPVERKETLERSATKRRLKNGVRHRMTADDRKQAQKEAQKRYREKHRDNRKPKKPLTPEQHERRLAYKRRWNVEHPEYMQRYRAENHERLIAQSRQNYARNRTERRTDARRRAAMLNAAASFLRSIGVISRGDADRKRRAALAYARQHGLL